MRGLLLQLVLISLVLLGACSSDTPQLKPLASDAIILAFGDSLTYGTGGGEHGSYPDQLQKLIGIAVVNRGVPGETSARGLERLPRVLEEVKPQLVLLCHGGNDMLQRLNREQLKDNLARMIDLTRAAGSEVLLLGVPSPGLIIDTPELYAELAEQKRIPYQGKILPELLKEPALKSDAVHLNAAGYKRLAEAIAQLMGQAGLVTTH